MSTQTEIAVREYLSTSYRPDREYVDGIVVDRNLGEKDHAKLQSRLVTYYSNRSNEWGIHAFVELRIRVSPSRFRIPDVTVVAGEEPQEQVLTSPPFICIEVLSPEDRISAMQERVGDFLAFGVPYVFILDPRSRKAYRCTPDGLHEINELRTQQPETLVPVEALFR